ncbi:MAG TPA: HAD family phosphatase [Rugosimonospora sp.]|nr:HAD family phosphatase [Rugosimonospora sp.]
MDAVIFDLDGVLLDSEPVWEEVRRGYVAEHGGHWLPDSQRRLMGMSTGEWARYLSEELGVGVPPERVAADVVGRMAERYAARVPLIAGAPEVVRRLGARWPLGLASSSPPRLIAAALAAAGLSGAFRATISTEEVPRGKPAPDVYLAVAQRLGFPARRGAAIEDSSNGVRAAAAAGMRVLAVPTPEYPLDADAADRATTVLSGLSEVTEERIAALG